MKQYSFSLANEDATVAFGNKLAKVVKPPLTIFLEGDLGAGKTTFSRGLIQALGHPGAVKSPTYTLVEPYEINELKVFHFDLYRLMDPEELEFMGIRDYFSDDSLCIVEWPEHGQGLLPQADIHIEIQYVDSGREVVMEAGTPIGEALLSQLQ
ncbi:tRNA (adenosine(37)-N6)-threonylcarbamoyltransferase complex ATPase subunit type 1 TsaE [Shewanella sp. 202IG2-18]|uniref:tRNA (adenosine(37)-N6)-threonylcarbamoyltransferase complex ATPase subunit type 1 TsaE n=1 Tax=Parashewanella hymeniacidonis TaxID=2807618 RepID=UPI0019610691|nr:tRNA (adenosine(37)-N6)-threonylcarbamoyltransferase complex ATPase subunit type 1 TsaE [Parashewanella hymeniacidonis]MBM7071599.1 tRNA (adenosine(37)-N6)-threonylcarbamoyltransferase complex ATPase subunit type 1 TsaE [Parashewanella hymeniacidonis]